MMVTDWEGGAYPEPEADLQADNICDIEGYIDVIVVYCTGEDLLPIVKDANNYVEAWEALESANLTSVVLYSGLLSGFNDDWKPLGELLAGDSHDFQVLVHLQQPQDANKMMGDYVVIDKYFRLDQTPCDYTPGDGGKDVPLPVDNVTGDPAWVKVQLCYPGPNSYWRARFDIPAGVDPGVIEDYDDTGTQYLSWCIDEQHLISNCRWWDVKLMSSLNPAIYSLDPDYWGYSLPQPFVFNYVNYLINTYDAGGGESNLQKAIWYFINNYTYAALPQAAKDMVDDALANGADYVPGTGDWLAVLLIDGKCTFQMSIIEVDP
jgi:hypothetical protein